MHRANVWKIMHTSTTHLGAKALHFPVHHRGVDVKIRERRDTIQLSCVSFEGKDVWMYDCAGEI